MNNKNNKIKYCKICGNLFKLKPKAYKRLVCYNENCIKELRKERTRQWRQKNKDYFTKKPSWIIEKWNEAKRKWRTENKDYWKQWRKKNKEKYNEYIRNYRNRKRITKS